MSQSQQQSDFSQAADGNSCDRTQGRHALRSRLTWCHGLCLRPQEGAVYSPSRKNALVIPETEGFHSHTMPGD